MKHRYRNSNPNGAARHSRRPQYTDTSTLPDTAILRDLLTPEDVENALDVLRYRIKKKNKRVALRVLKLYFGNAPKRKPTPPPEEPKRREPTMAEQLEEFYEELEREKAAKGAAQK